jgi:hypothetical protein
MRLQNTMNEETRRRAEIVLNHILQQIKRDRAALTALQPSVGWKERADQTAEKFVPVLVATADELIREVEQSLNSPRTVRVIWNKLKNQLPDQHFEQSVNAMDSALRQELELLLVITGETVSKLIADFLCRSFGNLGQNNRSTYPDLYFNDVDYSVLPTRSRGHAEGPARRGNNPTSVPDGIEIKSNKGARIRVDCHHDHQGLHLALTFSKENDGWRVYDVYLAYLSKFDYTRATRNTTATTEKFSFGHAPFISVTSGAVREAKLIYDESEP